MRRSRTRRFLRGFLALGLVVVLLVAFAIAFLETPPGSTMARRFLEVWGSRATGGTLALGDLDLSLWRRQAVVTALHLSLEGITLDAPRLEVDWSPKAGPHVRALRPKLVVRETAPAKPSVPAVGLAAQPWRALERLGKAEVVEGRLELVDTKGAPWLVLGRLDAGMKTKGGRRELGLRIADAELGLAGGGPRVTSASAEGTFALDGGRLVVEQARVAAGSSSLELHGSLERITPTTGTASARAALDGALVGSLSPGADVSGRITADAALGVEKDSVTGTLSVGSPALTVMGVGPWEASGRGRFERERLVVESLEARGYGGRIAAEGPIALVPTARTDARLRAEGIEVAALAASLAKADVPIAARADLTLRVSTTGWDVAAAKGSGEFALRPAPRPAARPPRASGLALSGGGRVRLEGRSVALEGARVEARGASAAADVRLTDGKIAGTWTAALPLASIDPLMADLGAATRVPKVYTGALAAEGGLGGTVKAPEATVSLRGETLAVGGWPYALEVQAQYASGRLALAPLSVRSGGGEATVTGSLPILAGAGEWDVRGDVESLDLAPALAALGVDGSGPATGKLQVEGPRATPSGRADLEAEVALAGVEEKAVVAIAGTSDGTRTRVERLNARLAGGEIEGKGSYDRASGALAANATASGIAWARLPLLPPPLRRLDGQLTVDLALEGTSSHPSGEAHAALGGATLDGAPLPGLFLDARADGERVSIEGKAGDAGFLKGAGPLEGEWPLRLEIGVDALPAQAILDAFPAVRGTGATLTARGTVTVDVPLRAPERLRYSADDLSASGKVRDLEWTTEPFHVEGDRDALSLRGLRLAAKDAALSVDGRVALATTASFDLAVGGKADLQVLGLVLPEERFSGAAALRLAVSGTAAAPEITGEASIDEARGRYAGVRWSALRLRTRFLGSEAEVEDLKARVLGGSLSASGRLPLRGLGAGRTAKLSFEAKDVDLARMLDAELRGEAGASLLISVEGGLEASGPTLAAMQASGRVVRLESKSPEGTLALDAPAEWRLENGRFEQAPLRLTGPLGTLEARGEARLSGGPAGGTLSVAGPFDLRYLSPFVAGTTLSGPARIDVRARWGREGPRLEGSMKVEDARLVLEDLAFAVSKLAGEVRFEGDRVALEATAAAGDGKLSAHGGMTLGPAFLGPADLTLEAERVPISYPEGFRGRASGKIRVQGDPDAAYVVGGEIALQQGFYTAEFDARTQSLERLDWQLAALRGGTIGEMLPLDVNVKLADPLRIRNSRARLDVLGALTISGTLAQPTATGRVSFREGGTLTLSRAEVRVSQGSVELNGYPGSNPEIELSGETRVGGVGIRVEAHGTPTDLQLNLTSPDRPDLTQTDLASMLLTGRTAAAAASQGGTIVAEELASTLGGVLQKGVGEHLLIDVSPDRSLLADDTDPTQRFNIGTRLAENLYVIYSTALDGTEKRWILDFNPRRGRIRFRVIGEEDSSYSFEATDRIAFDLWSRARRATRPPRVTSRVASVRFEGALPVGEEELRKAAHLEVGGRHRTRQREAAGDQVRAELVKRGYFGASVDTEAKPTGERAVDVVIKVTAGPRVTLQWTGDALPDKERKAAEAAWPAYASPEVAAAAVARAALVTLQTQGYYQAAVTAETNGTADEVEVALRVARGARGRGVRVDFDGNTALADEVLAAALPAPGSRAFFEALNGRSPRLTNPLRLAYARAGYVDARVLPPRTAVDEASGQLVVTFPVRERNGTRVAAIELPEEVVAAGGGGPTLLMKTGEPLDLSAYVADRDAIVAWYQREGWPDARIAGFLDPGPEGVSVRFAARPGPRPHVGTVRVEEEGSVRDSVIREAVTLDAGELVRPRELAESRERLNELGLFSSVDVRAEKREGDPDLRDVVVDVSQRPDVSIEYGVRYSTTGTGGAGAAPSSPAGGRLQLAGAAELASPFGSAWRVRGYSFLTTKRQTYGLNFDAAMLFRLRVRTQVLLYDDAEDETEVETLASHVRGVTFQQTKGLRHELGARRWNDRLRLQWGYTYKDVVYLDATTRDRFLSGNRAFLSLSLVGDERDSLTDPHRGVFWTATTELSRQSLGSDVDYVRLYGQGFLYLPLLGNRVVWAQGYRAGIVPGDDPLLLIENRFRGGGPTTVRGFDQDALGPRTAAGDPFGGQAVAVFNQELRFPIWGRVQGGLFWDAGNVWSLSSEFSLGDLRQSVGAGLRVMLPFGPIRLEYAWVLKPKPGEAKGRFVFGLGHAF